MEIEEEPEYEENVKNLDVLVVNECVCELSELRPRIDE